MEHPDRIFVRQSMLRSDGPFAPHLELFLDFLRKQRYKPSYIERQVNLACYFGRWLTEEGIELQAITSEVVAGFLPWLARYRHREPGDDSTLRRTPLKARL